MKPTRIIPAVLVALLCDALAGAADVSLGPAPRWYKPVPMALEETATEELVAEPKYTGEPLYGALRLGDGENSEHTVVVDLGEDWEAFTQAYRAAEGKVDVETCPARIYVDANNDQDLTNDGEGLVTRCTESQRSPGQFTIFTTAKCAVKYSDGAQIDYPMNLYMFPQRGKVKLKDGSARDYGRVLFRYRGASFQTTLPVGDASLSARFYDENSDGLIMIDDRDRVALDLNEDGEYDPNTKGPELYALDEPFHFRGESYVLKTYGPRGDNATVAVSEEKVPEAIYIAAGEPAPDFTMPTLDGGQFTLSDQRGKVVLLHFWATWCEYCLEELPNVIAMWRERKEQGLVMVGISLDRNDDKSKATDKVTAFAEEHEMTWAHIVEGKFWDSEVADLYQVSEIPDAILIGRDGTTMATDLRGRRLDETVGKALSGDE